ncbi:DUF2161 family putative PD-(D/E)XK-type phosphodiesterase [Marivivens sp. LCG002]|uniref:DUF2161 domain-containing phosphodiesterase n=1 Tax=Marivivens sp. LCG002 TaxID=3051171 RepID=UPI002554D43F|nr:DUF2161 family putative PD-(D/E)XK-type phosphodiesterase [Marivivens sp. LCG002]WIV52045.1 DUF2161 family putative PD-(D/E)XK-type phosphodiesterase [Marivivens sp. LCG002]
MREADLYPPVKAYLEAQGYEVKSEIGACDVVAMRGDEPPVIVELKLTFSLGLIFQAIERQTVSDAVYMAVPVSKDRGWKLRYKDIVRLCKRLGLGLLAVDVAKGTVQAHVDPEDHAPRKNRRRQTRLLREFERRVGDPNTGGTTRAKQMTSYRQDALRCLVRLSVGPSAPAAIKNALGVERAGDILRADHYGWFENIERGIYGITPKGREALDEFAEDIKALGL